MNDDLTKLFGAPISVYTRAEAIADGALVDVSDAARSVGWPIGPNDLASVVLTHAIDARVADPETRIRFLMKAWPTMLAGVVTGDTRVVFLFEGIESFIDIGPDDNGDPCITIGERGDF